MKKVIITIVSIMILIAISACSQSENTVENETADSYEYEIHNSIAELNAIILELMAEIDDLQGQTEMHQEENQRLVAQLSNLLRQPEEEILLLNGMTSAEILDNLIENSEAIATEINKFIGHPIGDCFLASIHSYEEHIVIRASDVLVNHMVFMPVLLFYQVERFPTINGTEITDFEAVNWDDVEWLPTISWTVAAYGDTWDASHMRIVQSPASRRHLTDLETVSLRFHDWNRVTPDIYQIEEMPGEYLWEESIRLARYHYGLQIRDLWFDDGILYIDFFPAVGRFNTGLGSIINAQYFR